MTTELQLGIPARDLNALTRKHHVDAMVIGSRRHGLWRSMFGGVASKLLSNAERPVFLAPVRVVGEGENCQLSVCLKTFQNILVTVDFSKNSDEVRTWLETLLQTFKASVTLLHVIDANFAEVNLSGRELENYRNHATWQFEKLKQRLQGVGGLVETELVSGTPWVEVTNRTRGDRFSLVLIGSHGLEFFQQALLGSVANEVAQHAELSLLFIPSGA